MLTTTSTQVATLALKHKWQQNWNKISDNDNSVQKVINTIDGVRNEVQMMVIDLN